MNCFVIEPKRNFVSGPLGTRELVIGHAVALAEDDPPAAGDQDASAEAVELVGRAEIGVHPGGEVAARPSRRRSRTRRPGRRPPGSGWRRTSWVLACQAASARQNSNLKPRRTALGSMIRVICWNTRAGLLLRTWTSVASLALNRLKTSAKSLNEVAPISNGLFQSQVEEGLGGQPVRALRLGEDDRLALVERDLEVGIGHRPGIALTGIIAEEGGEVEAPRPVDHALDLDLMAPLQGQPAIGVDVGVRIVVERGSRDAVLPVGPYEAPRILPDVAGHRGPAPGVALGHGELEAVVVPLGPRRVDQVEVRRQDGVLVPEVFLDAVIGIGEGDLGSSSSRRARRRSSGRPYRADWRRRPRPGCGPTCLV